MLSALVLCLKREQEAAHKAALVIYNSAMELQKQIAAMTTAPLLMLTQVQGQQLLWAGRRPTLHH